MSVRTVSVRLLAEISGYVSPLKAAIQTTKDLRTELGAAASAGNLDRLTSAATGAGLALTGGFLIAATAAARFEKAMSEVDAVAGATATEMQALSEAALQAGKDTSFSATEAAQAEQELAKAGLTAAEILGGALDGALSLAAAGSLDLAEAADVAAKAMNIFGLEGSDVEHVADVLAAAANKSATDVHELGFALKMGGLAAKNSGVSLEETIGTFAAFADNALTGSDAGTSFKTMLQMLAAPTEKSTERMKELGISAYDAAGNFVGIASLAEQLRTKLGDLTQEQRNEALATIFGADAMRAATVLFNEGEAGIREYTEAVNDQGAASEMAAKKTDNLMGDIERLTGSLETLFIEAGSGSNSGLRLLVQGLGELVDLVGGLPGPVLTAGTVIIGLAGGGLLAFAAFVKARGAMADLTTEMRAAGPVMGRMATGLEFTTRWAGRATAAFAALTIAGEVLRAFTGPAETDINGLNEALLRLGETGEVGGELARLFGDNLGDIGGDLATATSGFGDFYRGVESGIPLVRSFNEAIGVDWSASTEKIKSLDDALSAMVRGGNAEEAAAVFKRIWEAAQAQGVELTELQELFPQYVNAAGEATKAEQGLTASTEDLARAQLAATEAGEDLVDMWDRLHGKALTADELMLKAKESTDAITEAFERNAEASGKAGLALTGNSVAALSNRIALQEAAAQAYAAAEAYLQNGGSAEGAAAILQGFRIANEKAAIAAGGNAAEVRALNDGLYALPAVTNVAVNVTTTYYTVEDKSWRDYRAGERQRWGGVHTHAQAGVLREAGVFSAVPSGARYAFAEPATRGEAFVPKSGDYGRSMSILQTAAGWYGADVVPRQQGWYGQGASAPMAGGGSGAAIDYQQLGRAVATALRQSPIRGEVTLDGHMIGKIQGREADLLRRGG